MSFSTDAVRNIPGSPLENTSRHAFAAHQQAANARFGSKKWQRAGLMLIFIAGLVSALALGFYLGTNSASSSVFVPSSLLAPLLERPDALPVDVAQSQAIRAQEALTEEASAGENSQVNSQPTPSPIMSPSFSLLNEAQRRQAMPLKGGEKSVSSSAFSASSSILSAATKLSENASDASLFDGRKADLRIHPELLRAYVFLEDEQWMAAQQSYQRVLDLEPANIDALLGFASAVQHQGRLAEARRYYEKALMVDPNDASALASLLMLEGILREGLMLAKDAKGVENRLKEAITREPLLALPYFALGSLYAQGLRWQEAQQAFFEAFRIEPENADYVFNMAVSLDHLQQQKLALRYYLSALALSEKTPFKNNASFSQDQLKARINELEQ